MAVRAGSIPAGVTTANRLAFMEGIIFLLLAPFVNPIFFAFFSVAFVLSVFLLIVFLKLLVFDYQRTHSLAKLLVKTFIVKFCIFTVLVLLLTYSFKETGMSFIPIVIGFYVFVICSLVFIFMSGKLIIDKNKHILRKP